MREIQNYCLQIFPSVSKEQACFDLTEVCLDLRRVIEVNTLGKNPELIAKMLWQVFRVANAYELPIAYGLWYKYGADYCLYCHQPTCICNETTRDKEKYPFRIIASAPLSRLHWSGRQWQRHITYIYENKRNTIGILERVENEVSESLAPRPATREPVNWPTCQPGFARSPPTRTGTWKKSSGALSYKHAGSKNTVCKPQQQEKNRWKSTDRMNSWTSWYPTS